MMKISIVDDDNFYGSLIKERLNFEDHVSVILHANAYRFFTDLDSKPDVAIIDCSLPDLNGVEVLSLLKQYYRGVFVIILSSDRGLKQTFNTQGYYPDVYIVKDENAVTNLMESLNIYSINLIRNKSA
ncbi:MAG: DNA-binding NarL/FixJ family response regulator [Parvicellaceae bacterium]|jgi:DNA-binding NarL/FixJ family response regulator